MEIFLLVARAIQRYLAHNTNWPIAPQAAWWHLIKRSDLLLTLQNIDFYLAITF